MRNKTSVYFGWQRAGAECWKPVQSHILRQSYSYPIHSVCQIIQRKAEAKMLEGTE